jgi:hypothetical protein
MPQHQAIPAKTQAKAGIPSRFAASTEKQTNIQW